ncbi:MAG TPA: branched-chain amino acid ABC transporter permease [Acidimicrobiales bacterium]|nr:branched-chain amino acid ABC transporter permease [Acidimicrobiales bacterium]
MSATPSSPAATARAATAAAPRNVTRSARPTAWLGAVGVAAVVVLAFMPSLVSQADTSVLLNFFILLTMASMWNLLAGYAGMVSIGQQAFVGLGAYGVLVLADSGVNPVAAIPVAAVLCAALSVPISLLVFRLRGGYFAIATWVVADAASLVVSSIGSIGGGTGKPVPGMSSLSPKSFEEVTYWAALAVVVCAVGITYALLRSRLGLVLAAVRDNEVGARSAGVRVVTARRIVYLVAALGCGAAGALLAVSQLNVQPASVFNVQWSAEMIFVTMIGGIGTIEGPILGTVVFFLLQQNLAHDGAWYLIIFGALAVAIAIWAPRGLWGTATGKLRVQLFPVGFYVGRTRRRDRRTEAPPPTPASPAA